MRRARRISAVAVCLLLCVTADVAPGQAAGDAEDPAVLLKRAFEKMFNYPSVRTVELRVLRGGRLAGRKVFDVAYQKFGERGHTILRFRAPEYLRDNALLMIEAESGENDTWLYQPGEGRIRRVSAYQKADSFYGSDLTFEDLENRRWSNYEIRDFGRLLETGGEFRVIEASPRRYSQHSRILVYLSPVTLAIGRIEFYKGTENALAKTIRILPKDVVEEDGVFKPSRMTVEVAGREWVTEVLFKRIEVAPELTTREFSTMRLHAEGRDLFEMVDRAK